jgi:hypothetical protein
VLNCYERLLLLSFRAGCQDKSRAFVPAKGECGEFKALLQTAKLEALAAPKLYANADAAQESGGSCAPSQRKGKAIESRDELKLFGQFMIGQARFAQ